MRIMNEEVIQLIKGYEKSVCFTDQGIQNILKETGMDLNHLLYALFEIAEDYLEDEKM